MSTPRPYIRPFPNNWWLKRASYRRYMLRELTSVMIFAWSLMMVVGLIRLAQGEGAWRSFLDAIDSPWGIAFQTLALIAAVYHSVTWFSLAPRTMPLRLGGKRIAAGWITAGHYLIFIVLTLVILALAGV